MCIGACTVRGLVRTGGQEVRVAGGGFYDHPRVLAEANDVPPFGWYLYAPVRFSNGTMIVRFGGDTGQSIHEARSRLMLPRSTVLKYFAISEL
jgi:hypothetical protein